MRYGVAIDLHVEESATGEVTWRNIRTLAELAESGGVDVIVLPDHLAYRAGGEGDYSLEDERVGVREAMTIAAALAASTTRIGIGHSVINAPYRPPAMLAHQIAALADIAAGRYSPTIGAGNSFDYDQLGVDGSRRASGLEECVQVVAELLRSGTAHLEGTHWTTDRAELALRPDPAPAIIVAAAGPRAMALAARLGDGWNGWVPTDPESEHVDHLLHRLERACSEHGREPATIVRTADVVIDPLDLAGARQRSIETIDMLADKGFDEVRCWLHSDTTFSARRDALEEYLTLRRRQK